MKKEGTRGGAEDETGIAVSHGGNPLIVIPLFCLNALHFKFTHSRS